MVRPSSVHSQLEVRKSEKYAQRQILWPLDLIITCKVKGPD